MTMKKLLTLSIALFIGIWAMAQANWTLVNSALLNTQGVGQISIGMTNNTALWASAIDASGGIVDRWTKSTNSGATWTSGTFNAGSGLSQIFAINATTCWALFNTGANQGMYKTTDGGVTWVRKPTTGGFGASSFADAIHFFNNNDGVAMGDPIGSPLGFEIYTTADGGETWTRVPSANVPVPSTSAEYGITGNISGQGNSVWFGTNLGRVFHSVDKGLHWTAVLLPFGAAETVQPEFVDETHGIAFRSYLNLGLETHLNVTSDGGATWSDVLVVGNMYARFFSAVPGTTNTYIGSSSATGANGISVSYDGGYTWNVITSGFNFQASAWANNSTGWAGTIAAAKSIESTGGMYVYNGPALVPVMALIVTPNSLTSTLPAGGSEVKQLTLSTTGNASIAFTTSGAPLWATVNPASGRVFPSVSKLLDVTFNSTGLSVGTYTATLSINSSDPVTPVVNVPLTLTVEAVLCSMPTAPTVTNITYTTASIGWTGATNVQVDYGIGPHIAGTGILVSNSGANPLVLTGLVGVTTYQAWVRQDCGLGSYSAWVGPLNFTTTEQYAATVYPVNVPNGTGYITNATFLKKGPWMNIATALSDTGVGRGYVKFDVSSLPVNAIITKATLNYYNFYQAGISAATNSIYSLTNDPVSTSGATLYSDCGDGPPLWTGTWPGTAPVWVNSLLNATGIGYISDQLTAGWAGFGIRGSATLYRFSGYTDAAFKPTLQIEYHIATTPVLSVSPVSNDFEQVNLGIQSLPQTFRIKNAGSGNLNIDYVALGGADPGQFILTGNLGAQVLGPGASYLVTVVFKPTSTGVKTANLVVTESENDHSYPLTGTGYLNGPQNLTATPVIGPYVNLAWEAPLPLEEIRYDDNTAEAWYWIGGPTTTSQMFVTKITIPVNGTLNTIGVLSRSNPAASTWETVRLCPDNGGLPNLASPIQSFANVPVGTGNGAWTLLNTPLAVTAGQILYIVAQWPAGSTSGPSVATDTYSNHYRCTYTTNGGLTYTVFPYNLFMRAYMTVPGDNSSNEPIVLTSGSEVDGMQNLPVLVAGAELKPLTAINSTSVMAPAIVAPSAPNRSFTNYTLHRGTVSGTYTVNTPGLSGTTYQDVTTAPTTTYFYMVSAEYSNGTANSNEASVTTFELCPVPTTLTATGITATSANLGWTANGTTAWEIEWGPVGFTQGSGTMITTGVTNPYPLSGLASGLPYTYYVRSNCGGGLFSSWGGPYTFMTTCGSFAAPISEGFELATFPPACWARTETASTWERATNASGYGVGAASAIAAFYDIFAATTFDLVTLNFNAGAIYMPVLKFDYAYAAYSAVEIDQMDVYYSTNAGATYTLLLAMPGGPTGILNTGGTTTGSFIPTAAQWATQTLPLPAGTNMIKFTAISAYGNNLYLDNVKVEAAPIPVNLPVTGSVGPAQSQCFNAIGTITVSNFTVVAPNGHAEFIAGQNILFQPGTIVQSGAYMWGHITTTASYCSQTDAPMVAAAAGQEEAPFSFEHSNFSLYPNPTTGNFTLVQKGERQYSSVKVEIYGMRGNRVLSSQMIGEKQHEFVTSSLATGIYFVRLIADDYTETIKLIKTR